MRVAISEAKQADHPYGAAIVINGEIIAKAGSGDSIDPTAHAEIKAIRDACKHLSTNKLSGAKLYSTCEPCPMCFAAAWWAQVEEIVFGMSLEDSIRLYGPEININAERMNFEAGNTISLRDGILKEEVIKMFSERI